MDYAHIDRENSLVLSLNCHDSSSRDSVIFLTSTELTDYWILVKAGVTFRCFSPKQIKQKNS